MRVQRIGLINQARLTRSRTRCFCLLVGLCVLTLAARLGERETFAQTSMPPNVSTTQLGISPDQPVQPPQPIIVATPDRNAINSSPAQQTQQEKSTATSVEIPAIPSPDPKNPVAVQSANLLKLAYNLKAEVDKTTKDTLSVTVVREAGEIEQLARKMRTK